MPTLVSRRHTFAVPRLSGSLKKEAAGEARRDAESEDLRAPFAYQQRIEKECDHTIRADVEERKNALAELRAEESANRVRHEDVTQQLVSARQLLERIRPKLDELERPLWPGRLKHGPKWALLLFIGAFEYVLIRTALDVLDLDDYVKNLTAMLIGVVPIVAIELHGAHILQLYRWHGERIEKRRAWIFNAALLIVLGSAVVGFIVVMGVVRGEGFAAGGILADVPRSYDVSLAVGLALLQVIATAAALALTRQHADGDGWRKANDDVTRQESLVDDLEDELVELDEEYAELIEQHRQFRGIAEQHHLAVFDYFASREACYRTIFSRIHPDADASQNGWPAWQESVIKDLQPLYEEFDLYGDGGPPGGEAFFSVARDTTPPKKPEEPSSPSGPRDEEDAADETS